MLGSAQPLALSPALRLPSARALLRQMDSAVGASGRVISLGSAALDARLPWRGLPQAGLHEIQGTAALAWAFALASRVLAARAPAMMLALAAPGTLALYPLGGVGFGIAPEQIVTIEAGTETDRLWALEEALRSGCFAVVLAEAESRDLTVSRRLHLAAEAGACLALLCGQKSGASAALTRWHITPYPGNGTPIWRVALQRCRGGPPSEFIAGWDHDALRFHPTSLLGD